MFHISLEHACISTEKTHCEGITIILPSPHPPPSPALSISFFYNTIYTCTRKLFVFIMAESAFLYPTCERLFFPKVPRSSFQQVFYLTIRDTQALHNSAHSLFFIILPPAPLQTTAHTVSKHEPSGLIVFVVFTSALYRPTKNVASKTRNLLLSYLQLFPCQHATTSFSQRPPRAKLFSQFCSPDNTTAHKTLPSRCSVLKGLAHGSLSYPTQSRCHPILVSTSQQFRRIVGSE